MDKANSKTLTFPENREEEVNFQFKLLSAIGIIIIVSGHCYSEALPLLYNWFPAYTFNISLFVFISGYFYKPKHEDNALRYIFKRFTRLVVPAYLWNLFYGLLVYIFQQSDYTCFGEVTPYNLLIMPFIDGEALKINLGSWFVYPLFFVCAINVLLRKLLKLIKADNDYFLTALYLFFGMISVWLSINHQEINTGAMKLLLRVMFMLPLYQFGRLYRSRLEQRDNLNSVAYFAVIFAVQLVIIFFFTNLDYTPSSMKNFNNGFVLPFVMSVTGIAFWLRVTRILAPAVRDRRPVMLIADNTYNIMIHHMFGFFCVKSVFFLLSDMFGRFGDFNIGMYFGEFWFYYFPKNLTQFAVVYWIGAIAVSILMGKAASAACKAIKNRLMKKAVSE